MNEQLIKLIKQHDDEDDGSFSYMTVTDEMIAKSQADLGVTLPQQFVDFLKIFGEGGLDGFFEILGYCLNGEVEFVDTTLEYRPDGLPANLVAIQNCDEWLDCIDCDNGQVVTWSAYDGGEVDVAFPDFDSYLMDQVENAIDNM